MQRKRKRELRTNSSKGDFSINSHPLELREPHGRGGRKSVRARGRGHQENKVLSKLSKGHMNSQRLKQ